MSNQTPEQVRNERDALLSVVKASQEIAETSKRIIELLLVAGYVTQERVDQARKLAGPSDPINGY